MSERRSQGQIDQDILDVQCMQRLRDGDVDGFDSLFTRYSPRIQRMLMKSGATPETAEDITQETFLSVFKCRESFDGDRTYNVRGWLFTIARNAHIDKIRKERVRTAAYEIPWNADHDNFIASKDGDPVEVYAAIETTREVFGSESPLSRDHRRALFAVSIAEFDTKEAAEVLGVPTGTVKSRVHYGRNQLKALVAQ